MSESGGEKTFEPTRSRIERAKRDGDLPRSAELNGALAFTGGLCGVLFAVPMAGGIARTSLVAIAADPSRIIGAGNALGGLLVSALVPLAAAAAAGSAAAFLQNGGLRFTPVSLKLERLSPLEGCKRMLSREALGNAARAAVAVVCTAIAVCPMVAHLLLSGSAGGVEDLASPAWSSALRCAFVIAALGALFGGVDFAVALGKWRRKLRMSFEEVKRDHKEQDGDPAAKGRRRSMHRELSRQSLARLKDAAFVVVNPVHVAVALEYRPPEIPVPRVILRAAGETALRVRDAARELGIPVVQNIALARSLYAVLKAGDVIPRDAYVAVAEIVAALCANGALAE